MVLNDRQSAVRGGGFTLVELLVVVAIMAMLISILMPSLSVARRTAKETVCATDIRSLAMVSLAYGSESNGRYPDFGSDRDAWETRKTSYPYWTFVSWRRLFEKNYGIRRQHWYSVNNPGWSGDSYYYMTESGGGPFNENTATKLVMGRFYFGSEYARVKTRGTRPPAATPPPPAKPSTARCSPPAPATSPT